MRTKTSVATETLRTLHRIHKQLTDLDTRLRKGPNLIAAHQSHIRTCKAKLNERQNEAKTIRMAGDAKQGQLKDSEQKIEKLSSQLNTAASNKEYQALKDQIVATEMVNSVLTDEILEALEKFDEAQEKVNEAQAKLDLAEVEIDKAKQSVGEKQPILQKDIDRLRIELKDCESTLPEELRIQYERLVRVKGEDAMATVEGEVCNGCNQQIPINTINELMLSTAVFCKACGRLLYIPEGGQTILDK